MSLPPPTQRIPGRSLPRPGERRRAQEAKILAIDWAWVVAIALVAAANAAHVAHGGSWGHKAYAAVATLPLAAAFAYLSALVLRDRYAAVVAGVLTATSVTIATAAAVSVVSGVAIACVTAAWFLYERGWLVAASVVCGVAAICRPEMLLAGVLLTAFGLYDKKEQAGTGAAAYILILVAVVSVLVWRHHGVTLPNDFTTHGPVTVLWASGPAVLWFAVAFLTDLFDKHTRPRWLPITTWLIAFLAFAAFADRTSSLTFMAPAFVAAYIVSAAGVARVLPAVAGDHSTPVARYVVASIAVILLLCLRYVQDIHAAGELKANSPPVNVRLHVQPSPLPRSLT